MLCTVKLEVSKILISENVFSSIAHLLRFPKQYRFVECTSLVHKSFFFIDCKKIVNDTHEIKHETHWNVSWKNTVYYVT